MECYILESWIETGCYSYYYFLFQKLYVCFFPLSFFFFWLLNNRALFIKDQDAVEFVVKVDYTSDQFLSRKKQKQSLFLFCLFFWLFESLFLTILKKGSVPYFFYFVSPAFFLVFIRVQEPLVLQEEVSRTKWTRSMISCRKWRSWTTWTSFPWTSIVWESFPALPSISRVESIKSVQSKMFQLGGWRVCHTKVQKTEAEST